MSSAWIVESVDVSANGFFCGVPCLENGGPDEFCFDGLEYGFGRVAFLVEIGQRRSPGIRICA